MWWRPAWFRLKGKGSIRGQPGDAPLPPPASQRQPPDQPIHATQPLVGVVHQEQRHAVVHSDVAGRDILTIAAELRVTQRPLIYDTQEARRPAAVLHVGPARLGDRSEVEPVLSCDEGGFCLADPVVA